MSRMLVLDFDGTITDAEAEGKPFRLGYLEDIAILTGQPVEQIQKWAERFEAVIAENPDQHGWIYNGQIVAPATVDPYLRIMPVARMIFDQVGAFPVEQDRTRLLDGILYKYNYQKTAIAFKPGAREILTQLSGRVVYVVTNSHTDPVKGKIRTLHAQSDVGDLSWLVERVYGSAKKYMVDPDFTMVPEFLYVPGLSRPVLLRRSNYYRILDQLRTQAGVAWEDVTVVGDIFELDLALPLTLGTRVGLVTNDFTPAYEKEFLKQHPRGRLIEKLSDIASWLEGS